MKRPRIGDCPGADRRLPLSPRVSSKRKFSNCSLASDAHYMKKKSICRDNPFDDTDNATCLSPLEPAVIPSRKKSQDYMNETLYPLKSIPFPNDVCSVASSVDSCGDQMCDKNSEALCSDADSSTLLRRKVGSCTLIVRWRGVRPQADRSILLRRKVGSYTLVLRCGGVRPQAKILHRSELKSYRRTLEEFYANGPLSWEQQGYLAELRSRLHISNEEHLIEDEAWNLGSVLAMALQ